MESFLLAAILLTTYVSVAAWSNTKKILERMDRMEAGSKTKEISEQG
ncbi:MAG: hypothetical protein WCY82_08070 [Desulfotomaculaceae bacterium]